MKQSTGIRRLYKLIEYMDSLPKSANKHFDMRYVVNHEGDHDHKIPQSPTKRDLHTCGTSACALGWAATIPSFNRAGLVYDYQNEDGGWDCTSADPVFFGIDDEQFEVLFGAYNEDRTPKQWAARARKMVKQWRNADVLPS